MRSVTVVPNTEVCLVPHVEAYFWLTLLLVCYRIGYTIPMFTGFVVMMVSTISKY